MTEKEFEQLPMMLTVDQMRKVLNIGKNSAYELIYQKNFPILKLGERKIRIPKKDLLIWIENNTKNYEIG
ncbi:MULTISPECIES: helix-turn-helix domain-containing protein [Clostridium]|uniref:Helix-turn-helix domain-containing protein n=1 Tax=Clostridium sporogenes TaxID=1509 RepID=A0A7X5PCX1_CLOSG|nr:MULTISPECIES: helix-turn-helix domain-containing protein [Clostridium]AJD32097.1 DNA binding, excisionase family domain protein [Clostridium botulinum Prevot_594]KEI90754.1 DNA-binding protein [Clostridium botulinum B2 433]MBY7016325.1 helix-turn-helix domain-containing protein [Clostridium sporogenes]MCW6079005.1 helix-turn-helix domain-containing protein [Clostridium sporogenes]NFQ18469.1 helix-turn-helix domain-containing protein [Clostridium sporogenes]